MTPNELVAVIAFETEAGATAHDVAIFLIGTVFGIIEVVLVLRDQQPLIYVTHITDGLLRFSVGIEDEPDLLADLEKGFQAAAEAR